MTDRIEVRGLRVLATCGVGDEERAHPQPLVIDLDVELDAAAAATSDAVTDTVDYAPLCAAAATALTATRPRLLETACEAVGRAVLAADGRVVAVTIAVSKLRPPIPLDVATVAVRRRVER